MSLHLKNIFNSEELDEDSVTEEFSVTASDRKKYKIKHYKTIAFLGSKSLSGKLKGKITLKLTEELEPSGE